MISIMILSNYHSHFKLDDGIGELNEYAEAAIEKGLSIIGISPHAPLPYENAWTLTEAGLREYFALLPKLKAEYSGRLEILCGLEIDFIPDVFSPAAERWNGLGLEYRIGSVHSIANPATGRELSVDGPVEEMIELHEVVFKGDIRALVTEYFRLQRQMIKEGGFDILGHCDLVKKRNKDNRFFDQNEEWYKKLALEMLQTAAGKDIVIEVNTGGLSRGATTEVYPSPWMLKQCLELDIPLTLSADAHNPAHIDFYFKESLDLLRNIGFKEIYFFSKGKWHSQPIN